MKSLLLARAVSALVILCFAATPLLASSKEETFNLDGLMSERDPKAMFDELKKGMQEKVAEDWSQQLREATKTAVTRRETSLYPNPIIQGYVNRLGQSLIPPSASEKIFVTFRVVSDPFPFADAFPTGIVHVSTGLLSIVENESQLAFVLMHEAAHILLSHDLQQIIEAHKAERREKRIKLIGMAASAVIGKAIGGETGTQAIALGIGGSFLGGEIHGRFRQRRYLIELQKESDRFAGEVMLNHGFDAREASPFLNRVAKIVGRSSPAVGLAFGSGQDLGKRSGWMAELLSGTYAPTIDHILDAQGFRMSSPRFGELMAEIKRDNGLMALHQDAFALARFNLEEAAAIRTDDPITMFGLGQLYHQVARTEEDLNKATAYLRSAMEFDDLRHRFPKAHLYFAVDLLSREDPNYYPEIRAALKRYVVFYQRKSGGRLPPEIQFVYDYLARTGDSSWVAFEVDNTSTVAPYQTTGNPAQDSTSILEESSSP